MRHTISSLPFLLLLLLPGAACVVGDEADEATSGASIEDPNHELNRLSGCRGQASSSIPGSGMYRLTTFGGPGDHQSMSCGGYADGTTWYAASRQRYGCGSKLKLEANGKCAIVTALDYGPDVCVENAAGMPIIDVSPKASRHLFGEAGVGYSDRLNVKVTKVAASTPVGPCSTTSPTTPTPPSETGAGAACDSATLGRSVEAGVCVQGASDAKWYQCSNGEWLQRTSLGSCTERYGFCSSATLGRSVPPRTCVQAASDDVWYQCNGQTWVSPVTTATRQGPIGTCSSWNPL